MLPAKQRPLGGPVRVHPFGIMPAGIVPNGPGFWLSSA
jgi:hypothetical protein